MFKTNMKTNQIFKLINNSLINLPTPINISMWWNFGSLLGLMLMIQIISGLFLSMNYCANTSLSFNNLINIMQNINSGWLMRLIHMNGASMFFMFMYIHIGRGLYYGSYNFYKPWTIGILIFMLSMATAFMGYVLPWGQMSFWGATVITNLISTIPYIGTMIVEWIWGGYSISNPTLNRFFTLHFILPFIILMFIIIHLMFIHESGSSNPLGIKSKLNMINFHIYFTLKDLYGFMISMMILMMLILMYPYMLSDPENFIMANLMITPIHIQPEWYFLFAYTILRSIPNKLGGVISLLMSIMILLILPISKFNKFKSSKFYPSNKLMFWYFINIIMILTWLGTRPIESPFMELSQLITFMYFLFFTCNNYTMKIWDKFIM